MGLRLMVAVLMVPFLVVGAKAGEFPKFEAKTIDPNIGKVCYAVTISDVNGDKKPDIVAVSENRVLWYRNPDWKSFEMIRDQTPRDNVCIAPMDIDRDGKVDFAIGAGWTSKGTIHWLRRSESLESQWNVYSIGEERWLHRMRWADVLGTGRSQLVISPLNATVGNGVRLTAFEIPDHPAKQRWPATILNSDLNRVHNHWHVDLDGDSLIDTLVASREGVQLVQRAGDRWSRVQIGVGAESSDLNQRGAGEIKTGRLGNGKTYIATVEPMHGDQLVVYTPPNPNSKLWDRHVVDRGFRRGHALWTADVDGDGTDEIVFGHSDTPNAPGVNVYDSTDPTGSQWSKHVIDAGGVATEDLMVADLTGDGRLDIVAGGRATHNVVLYINRP